MAKWINEVTLLGNVGADPEVRALSLGGRVASFSLATTDQWQAEGQKRERTEWHRCQAFNAREGGQQLADVVERYVKKGDRLLIRGSLHYREWQKDDGTKGYATEIKVRDLTMLTGRRDDA